MTGEAAAGAALWEDHRAGYPTTEFPDGQRFDTVVVGAGFTGLVTALQLAEAGQSVAVLESRRVGAGASGATTAKLSILQGVRLSAIRHRHGAATAKAYAEASRFGLEWWSEFCDPHGVRVQRPRAVTYARSTAGVAALRAEHAALKDVGEGARWHERLDVPFPVQAAVELPEQMQFDPGEALAALANTFVGLGGQLVEDSRVTGMRVRGTGQGKWAEVKTSRGTVLSDDVILATASPILDRGITVASMEAERSYLCAFEYTGGLAAGMYGSVESPMRSLRTVPDGDREVLLVGGNGHRTGSAGSTKSNVTSLEGFAARYFPEARLTHHWSAQDFHPVTMLPYAGPIPWGRGRVYFAGGYSKWGVTSAPAAALRLADRVLERPERIPFGRPAVAGIARTVPTMYADLPIHMLASAIRAGLPPKGQATENGEDCNVRLLCPHMGAPLAWNDAESTWDCPLHGSRFTACGSLLEGPATRDLKQTDR